MIFLFFISGGRKAIPSKALPPIESEREINDEELKELALTICSSEVLNGMIDANWKTRLANVQEFSQVFKIFIKLIHYFVNFIIN